MKRTSKLLKTILLLTLAIAFAVADNSPISYYGIPDDAKTINISGKRLSVTISCFGCQDGFGIMVAHHPEFKNLNYYDKKHFDIRWYTRSGKPYASNTILARSVCGERFIVVIKDLKTGDYGATSYTANKCEITNTGPGVELNESW